MSAARRHFLLSNAAYVAVFAVAAWPWLVTAGSAIPAGTPGVSPEDARLIVWIQGWVTHALTTAPSSLFGAPSYFPSPNQVTGSEHFLSSQIVFAPVYLLSRNAVLATNVIALLSYPFAAIALQQLAMQLGCSAPAAWVAGLMFALGPIRVPGNLQLLQYLNLYLPLVCFALHRLREHPTLARAACASFCFGLAIFSSYYLAVMVSVTAGPWAAAELARPAAEDRRRFVAYTLGALALPVVLLALFSIPYFARAAFHPDPDPRLLTPSILLPLLVGYSRIVLDPLELALGGIGLLLVASRTTTARPAARFGALVLVVGILFLVGGIHFDIPGWEWTIGLPAKIVFGYAARFMRAGGRFLVVTSFGTSLLAAATLHWLHERTGWVPISITALLVLALRAPNVSGSGRDELVRQPFVVADAFGAAMAAVGGGPMLELPLWDAEDRNTEADSMIADTRHWTPLILGCSGYPPPHASISPRSSGIFRRLARLEDIVAMTHLNWIVLEPRERWPVPHVRDAVAALPGVHHVMSRGGWDLLGVDLPPTHPHWFAAIARGRRSGETIFGTPVRALAASDAVALVVARTVGRSSPQPGGAIVLEVAIQSRGSAPWPVSFAPGSDTRLAVGLVARWNRGEDTVLTERFRLERESIRAKRSRSACA